METSLLELELDNMALVSPEAATTDGSDLIDHINHAPSKCASPNGELQPLTLISATHAKVTKPRLPVEIWAYIFELAVVFAFDASVGPTLAGLSYHVGTQLPTLESIVHVCEYWRSIACTTERLWTTIVVDPMDYGALEMINFFIAHSGTQELYVCVHQQHEFNSLSQLPIYEQCFALLRRSAHRIRVLAALKQEVCLSWWYDWSLTLLECFRSETPEDDTAQTHEDYPIVLDLLAIPPLPRVTVPHFAINDMIQLLHRTQIRCLEIQATWFLTTVSYATLPFWSNLRRLKLVDAAVGFDCLRQIVERCPALEALSLRTLEDKNYRTFTPGSTLLHLRELNLRGCVAATYRMLRGVHFPALENVALDMTSRCTFTCHRHCPLAMHFDGSHNYGTKIAQVLADRYLQGVSTLRMVWLSDDTHYTPQPTPYLGRKVKDNTAAYDAFMVLRPSNRANRTQSVTILMRNYGNDSKWQTCPGNERVSFTDFGPYPD